FRPFYQNRASDIGNGGRYFSIQRQDRLPSAHSSPAGISTRRIRLAVNWAARTTVHRLRDIKCTAKRGLFAQPAPVTCASCAESFCFIVASDSRCAYRGDTSAVGYTWADCVWERGQDKHYCR